MYSAINQESITRMMDEAKKAFIDYNGGPGRLQKSIDLSTGLQGTPLEQPAKLLVPLLSPFRQTIARETIGQKQQSYKRILAVSPTGGFFPTEGTRANLFALTTDTKTVTFRSYGRGGNTTWEAQVGGRAYEDARARDEALLALQVLKEEELVIFGGNRTALTAPASVVVTAGTSGGLMADATYKVRVFALTMEAVARGNRVARPGAGNTYDCANPPTVDTAVGFSAASSEGSGTISGGSGAGKLTITWTPTAGAVAYAVYISTTTGAGNQKLQCITTQSKAVITKTNTTGAADPTGGDTSANTAAFDGIIPQLADSSSGSYIKAVGGPLSAAVGNQIPEIQAMLDDIYDRTKQEPDRLVMGWQEANGISQALTSVANDRIQIVIPRSEAEAGELPRIEWYKSPRGKRIKIEENPNLPGGMVLGLIDAVPYPNSEIPAAWKMWMGSDLIRLDYALTDPKYNYEIRAYGALTGYAPALQGIAYDIWAK